MRVAVLGATGGTGQLLVQEALDRGLEVVVFQAGPLPGPDRPPGRLRLWTLMSLKPTPMVRRPTET